MTFSGFSEDTIPFLRELEASNTKAFFEANRDRFERVWVQPACSFVIDVAQRLEKLAPEIQGEPRMGGSLMRMNRDVRFAKDKSPYKTHLDLFFWEGDQKSWERPGFFIRLTTSAWMCGAGVHLFDKEMLARYRAAVLDEKRGAALARIVAKLQGQGVEVGEETLKKIPKGFDAAHPRAALLRFGGLHATVTTAIPPELTTPMLVGFAMERFKKVNPLRAWLSDALAQ